jgi:hypothetical protein
MAILSESKTIKPILSSKKELNQWVIDTAFSCAKQRVEKHISQQVQILINKIKSL